MSFSFDGAILGIDHGLKVIGLALSHTGYFADPLTVIHRKSKAQDFAKIREVIGKHKIENILLGLPPVPPGFVGHSQADTVRIWAGRLAEAVAVPIYLWDEGLSSVDARAKLGETGASQPERIDAHAAAQILQTCLDAIREGTGEPQLFTPKP